MSSELSKGSRIIMGALSVSFLLASAASPFMAANSKETLDAQKAMSDEKIQATYADICIQRDAEKTFKSSVKTMGANGPYTVVITADPNAESVKSCPKNMHAARIHAANAVHDFDILAGFGCLAFGVMTGYLALGGGKKKEPKPS